MTDWIQTHAGLAFFPFRAQPRDMHLVDIAWALALQCRFGGHCKWHYSVAQHAVLVSLRLEEVGAAPSVQFWGLHHDDVEAYLVDIHAPVKHRDEMAYYRHVEHQLQRVLAYKFDLDWPMPEAVKFADREVLAREAEVLMGPPPLSWDLDVDPDPTILIHRMSPDRARELYLARHAELARAVGYPSKQISKLLAERYFGQRGAMA